MLSDMLSIEEISACGINQENAGEYFKNPKIQAVGGSWMVSAKMIEAAEFDAIAEKSAAATALFQQIRG